MEQKIDYRVLEQRIREVEGLSSDERSALLELLHTKKYGLVWKYKSEDVEERLRKNLPVLKEDKELALLDGGADAPNHILIEGDNLEALTALTYTHEGKVDVIYIDPPYNTGNKDFVYNDKFVDAEDAYRHSKWLSFMNKRLKIAKRLLSDRGVIFISIDDNEQANLKLLCDEVFGEKNSIGEIIWETATDNNPTQISIEHEYVFCFAKFKENLPKWFRTSDKAMLIKQQYLQIKESGISNLSEIRRLLKSWINKQKKSGEIDLSGVSHYDYVDEKGVYYPGNSANTKPGDYTYDILHPITGKVCAKPANGYRWPSSTFWAAAANGDVLWGKDETIIPKIKKRLETATELLKSYYYEDGRAASSFLDDILGSRKFNNPKPLRLINKLLVFSSLKDSIILDFFAGSGTTLHATMQLNAEDGGKRQCILVTNNENNICRDVTYERNKRVIQGYTTPKGAEVEGLMNNNLRYYRVGYVERERSEKNMQELVRACTDLLCIKEDLYQEQSHLGTLSLEADKVRYFDDGKHRMLVIYQERSITTIVRELEEMKDVWADDEKIKVYLFSPSRYAYDDDFATVESHVVLCALPAAIYDCYQRVLPKARVRPSEIDEEGKEVGE